MSGERQAIRVRGDCGHEWTAKTTKAGLIHTGKRAVWDRLRVRLYCPVCCSEKGRAFANSHLQPVEAVDNRPRCACGTVLSRYNDSDTCSPCQRRAVAAA